MFTEQYRVQRQRVQALPDRMENERLVGEKLEHLFSICPGVVAVEEDRLVGYMGWFTTNHFRETDRKGAYCPEWGHAAASGSKMRIYRAMYREASALWSEQGCQVHALSILAGDAEAVNTWFWNGFGLTVVDAVRPIQPPEVSPDCRLAIRKAVLGDAAVIAALDGEHWQHYTRPPVFMAVPEVLSAEKNAEFLQQPKNSVWLAFDDSRPVGLLRFNGYDFDGVEIVAAEGTVAITGAFVRPEARGQGAAQHLLAAALGDYAARGFLRCSLNFESFNPEAASFWPRFFTPVCFSLVRAPEVV